MQHISYHEPDQVDRISISYHRVTKMHPKVALNDTQEYIIWDYSEQLLLDRETETIEHIQTIGTGCIISRQFKVEGGVEELLNNLNADNLFKNIEGNPPDVIVTQDETIDYTITIDFKKNPQRIMLGSFDKRGLPNDWEEFAKRVFSFMSFYGFGEILNPSVYGKVKPTHSDYIYCSVIFDEGYKEYYYIADDDSIKVGDYVVVPVGKDYHTAVVKVVDIEYFSKEDVPLPIEKTKHILRKCMDEDFDF